MLVFLPLLFFLCALPFSSCVRMPLDQMDPEVILLESGTPPLLWKRMEQYHAATKYCHHYPDIMCYGRNGNGYSEGDSGLWMLSSVTNSAGFGSIRIRFPQPYDTLDVDGEPLNGWFHPLCSHPVAGVRVLLTSFSPDVRIGPEGVLMFRVDMPMGLWSQDLYVEYYGLPKIRHRFAMTRRAIFADSTPPPYWNTPPPVYEEDGPDHSDL